ncbi:MAG: stalk domain-containing protein [Caldiserica bacterium]|jgi:hypothetical protein|nr:stalk domain-containing protein [Caldisericota bacterium]MDH7562208.1 stalk domain-containing protein [Caldisericota bacterium]
MKKILLGALLLCFLLSFSLPGRAMTSSEEVLRLQIDSLELWKNGQTQEIMDVSPFLMDNRTWVPIRFVSEALGAKVDWKQDTQEVTISMEGKNLVLKIDSPVLLSNGNPQTMDVAPFLMENRTWVPLRFVAENLGCNVSWIQGSKEVIIRRGDFQGPTVAFIRQGKLVMQEIKGNKLGAEKILWDKNTPSLEIPGMEDFQGEAVGPIAWSLNGLKIAFYRYESIPDSSESFKVSLEYVVESSGVVMPLWVSQEEYGGLKPLSWGPGDWELLFDEPTSDVSGTLWVTFVEMGEAEILGEEGKVVYGIFSPDGIHMAWLAYNDQDELTVQVRDKMGMKLEVDEWMGDFAWSPDGRFLAVNTAYGIEVFDVYNPASDPDLFTLEDLSEEQVFDLYWSPDGTWLAGSSLEGVVVLDLFSGDLYLTDETPDSRPCGFLPSGELVIEHPGEGDGESSNFYLYDPNSGELTLIVENASFLQVRPN